MKRNPISLCVLEAYGTPTVPVPTVLDVGAMVAWRPAVEKKPQTVTVRFRGSRGEEDIYQFPEGFFT